MKKEVIRQRRGLIFVLSAPSGTGKTTVAQKLLKVVPGLVRSVSLNTRPPRPQEKDGVDYYFVSEREFEQNIQEHNLIEYTEIYGTRRGTPKNRLQQNQKNGFDTLCVIEWAGMKNLRREIGTQDVVAIFLLPPSLTVLRQRLVDRAQDSLKEIERRLAQAESEVEQVKDYDYAVINDQLDVCVATVAHIIAAERHRVVKV